MTPHYGTDTLITLLEAPGNSVAVILRIPEGKAGPLLDPDIPRAEVVVAVCHWCGLRLRGAGGGGGLLTYLHPVTDPGPGGGSSYDKLMTAVETDTANVGIPQVLLDCLDRESGTVRSVVLANNSILSSWS